MAGREASHRIFFFKSEKAGLKLTEQKQCHYWNDGIMKALFICSTNFNNLASATIITITQLKKAYILFDLP